MDVSKYRVTGLVAATFTPFKPNGDVDVQAIPYYAKNLTANGVTSVFVNGTTGEFSSLTTAERKATVEAWLANNKHGLKNVMVHVGTSCIREAQEMAHHAEQNGADAIGMISPSFFKPPDVETIVEFSRLVAERAPKTPFYYYHLPKMTGVYLDMIEYMKQAEKKIPTFRGIKYSHLDLSEATQCVVYGDKKYNILWGVDQQLLAALSMGLDAAIGSTYNYLAPVFNSMITSFYHNDILTAQKHMVTAQNAINTAFRIGSASLASQKAAMGILTPINVGQARMPIPNLTDDVIERMRTALSTYRS